MVSVVVSAASVDMAQIPRRIWVKLNRDAEQPRRKLNQIMLEAKNGAVPTTMPAECSYASYAFLPGEFGGVCMAVVVR